MVYWDVGRMAKEMSFLRRFSSWFIIAALLPVVVFAATNRDSYTLWSQAAGTNELRLWIEPSRVVTSLGKPVKLTVYAAYENDEKLLNGVNVLLSGDAGTRIAPTQLSYHNPFTGRVFIGEFSLIAQEEGTSNISVTAIAKDTQQQAVQVITSPATIIVK